MERVVLRVLKKFVTPQSGIEVKLNAARVGSLNAHRISSATPGAEMREVFGPRIDVWFTFGRETVLVGCGASGPASDALLKSVVRATSRPALGSSNSEFFALRMQLARFAELARKSSTSAASVREFVAALGRRDGVTVSGSTRGRSVRMRFEVEEGVLRALARGIEKSAASAMIPR